MPTTIKNCALQRVAGGKEQGGDEDIWQVLDVGGGLLCRILDVCYVVYDNVYSKPPAAGCFGAVAIAGIGGSAFNPNSGRFLVTNSDASGADLTFGTVDVINPNLGSPNGPFVENSFRMPNCMPTSIVQGPGNDFLVGCGDHDG